MTHAPSTPPVTGGLPPHRGPLILVLGILGIVVCAPVGPFAWYMGHGDMQAIDAGRMDPEGRGLTQAGMICGITGTVLLALQVLGFLFFMLMFVVMAGAAAAAG